MSASSQPTFRPVTDADREFLREVFFSSWDRALAVAAVPQEAKAAVLAQQFEAQERSYKMTHPDADHALILIGAEPVGRLYVRREAEAIGLMDITLLPAWRNRGIGTGVVQGLIAEAGAAGTRVELYVEKWNPEARRLYARLGFAEVEDIGSHWKMEWRAPR